MISLTSAFQSTQSLGQLIREENLSSDQIKKARNLRKYHAKKRKQGREQQKQAKEEKSLLGVSCRRAILEKKPSYHHRCHKVDCPCRCHLKA